MSDKVEDRLALIIYDRSTRQFFALNPIIEVNPLSERDLYDMQYVTAEVLNVFETRGLISGPRQESIHHLIFPGNTAIGKIRYQFVFCEVASSFACESRALVRMDTREGRLTRLVAQTIEATRVAKMRLQGERGSRYIAA